MNVCVLMLCAAMGTEVLLKGQAAGVGLAMGIKSQIIAESCPVRVADSVLEPLFELPRADVNA